MNSDKSVVKTEDVAEAIQLTASAVLEAIEGSSDHCEWRDCLEQLRETVAKARQNSVPEDDIEKTLEDVRQSYPDVLDPWSEILEQIEVSVWLKDPDGERVRGDTVTIDRIIWENFDDDLLLEVTVQDLHDDLEADWEIVDVSKITTAATEPEQNGVVA
jgi:hypothetical protein